MNKFFLILMIVICFESCTYDKNPNLIEARGLKMNPGGLKDIIFLNDQVGYAFGFKSGDAKWEKDGGLSRVDSAIIYKTVDGGNNWSSRSMGRGSFISANISENKLYALLHTVQGSSIIYQLNKSTQSWQEYCKIQGSVKEFCFYNDGLGVINVNIDNKYKIAITTDKGRTWSALDQPMRIDKIIIKHDSILYLGSTILDPEPFSTKFSIYDINRKKFHHKDLPLGFRAHFMSEYNNDFLFWGTKAGGLNLFKMDKAGQFTSLHHIFSKTRIFPKKMHAFGNKISLFVGERRPLYIYNRLVSSIDQGVTWSDQPLQSRILADPIAFLNQQNKKAFLTWIYIGPEKIQLIPTD